MPSLNRKIHPVSSIAPNRTITWKLPTKQMRYDALFFRIFDWDFETPNGAFYTDAELAERLGRIRVKADGVTLVDVDAAYYLKARAYYGYRTHSRYITVNFFRPEMRDIVAERAYGLNTGDIDNLTVELEVKGFTSSLDIMVTAMCEPDTAPLGKHFRIAQHTYGTNLSVGKHVISDLPIRGKGRALGAFHFNVPRFFENYELRFGGEALFENAQDRADYEMNIYARTMHANSRYQQSDWYMTDVMCGRASDLVSLDVATLELELDITSPQNGFSIITEVRHEGLTTI